jgi:hydrogenase maturation protease
VLVIGVGNPFRRDDGVGRMVAGCVRARAGDSLRVLEESGEGAGLMSAWEGADVVFIIDAVSTGAEPGTIYHIETALQPLPAIFLHYSSHAFGVAEAVELARTLGTLPPRVVVYGVEGASFEQGTGLTPEVEDAAHHVVRSLLAAVRLAESGARR